MYLLKCNDKPVFYSKTKEIAEEFVRTTPGFKFTVEEFGVGKVKLIFVDKPEKNEVTATVVLKATELPKVMESYINKKNSVVSTVTDKDIENITKSVTKRKDLEKILNRFSLPLNSLVELC